MTRDSQRFLQPEEISRISRLEVRARQIVEGFLSGLHRSPYYGQSVEFVQHREYVPGDDFRRIDWKVWSKTDKYYIKQYEEDTNLRTLLLVDVSESMNFGTGAMTKYDYACTVAAALAYLLLRQQDAVGLVTFDDQIRTRVPTRSRQSHLHSIIKSLHGGKPASKTGIDRLLGQVAEVVDRPLDVVPVEVDLARRERVARSLAQGAGPPPALYEAFDRYQRDLGLLA